MSHPFSGAARFQEPSYVSALDDPEPDTWTHKIEDDASVPLLSEMGWLFGHASEGMELECSKHFDPHTRRNGMVVLDIHVPSHRGQFINLDLERDALSHEIAAAVRRWASTLPGQAALKGSFADAVQALIDEAAE